MSLKVNKEHFHICKKCGITFINGYKTATLCTDCFDKYVKKQPADSN